jgi:hypothetical protein
MSAASKPTLFVNAILLLWLAWVFSLVRVVADTHRSAMPVPMAVVYGLFVIVFAVRAFFIYKISIARNWARIVYICAIAVGLIRLIPDSISEISTKPMLGLIDAVPIALQIVAICFLFTPSCSELFKKRDRLV